jgi:hypothetical protein
MTSDEIDRSIATRCRRSLRKTAFHEAGHAVIAIIMNRNFSARGDEGNTAYIPPGGMSSGSIAVVTRECRGPKGEPK